jgi:hypothetical protein
MERLNGQRNQEEKEGQFLPQALNIVIYGQ